MEPLPSLEQSTLQARLAQYKGKLILSLVFFLAFYLVYGVADFVSGVRGAEEVPTLSFEAGTPFLPEFSIFYLSLYPLMAVSLCLYPTQEQLLPLFRILLAELLIGGIIFIVMPTVVSRTAASPSGSPEACLFWIADTLNLRYNAIPSLHVAFACTLADLYRRRLSVWATMIVYCWVFGIVCSTIFLHQHRLLDVWAGIALAYLCLQLETRLFPQSFDATS